LAPSQRSNSCRFTYATAISDAIIPYLEFLWPVHYIHVEQVTTARLVLQCTHRAAQSGTERVMGWNVAKMVDRAVAPMPILMILIAGALTKAGHPDWGLAWIAGLSAAPIMADLLKSSGRIRSPTTNRITAPDRP